MRTFRKEKKLNRRRRNKHDEQKMRIFRNEVVEHTGEEGVNMRSRR